MGEITEVAWADGTFNCWEGCEAVSPGCDFCYAETRDLRFTGGQLRGTNATRRIMSNNNWKEPGRWNKKALKAGTPLNIFCGSLCDWADNKAPAGQRERLWTLIQETPMLNWMLLTKRAPNIKKYLPDNWGSGFNNVWLGVTVENRKHGIPRIEQLRKLPAKVRFLSIEPLIEDLGTLDLTGIHWVIIGGESSRVLSQNIRKMEGLWVENIITQCRSQNVPVFFKQWGGKSADKGGCLINNTEIKEWPKQFANNL